MLCVCEIVSECQTAKPVLYKIQGEIYMLVHPSFAGFTLALVYLGASITAGVDTGKESLAVKFALAAP